MHKLRLSLIIISLILCCLHATAQDREVCARVVDAVTNKPLPYASVYAVSGKGTITNADGDFTINTSDGDRLRFTYVGYETLNVPVANIHNTVKMKPLAVAIDEVTVMAPGRILVSVSKNLEKEYRKNKRKRSTYFFRMNTTYHDELIEAFVEASSAINLRDLLFLKGRRGKATLYGLEEAGLDNTNLQHMLELGPKINDCKFWDIFYTPFNIPDRRGMFGVIDLESLNYFYNVQNETLIDEEGKKTYKITLTSKRERRRYLTGTLYIDAETLQMLRFDGQLENMQLEMTRDFYSESSPTKPSVVINYKHDKGYTEVASIAYTISTGNVTSNSLLYNIDDLDIDLASITQADKHENKKTIKQQAKSDNMLASIDDAGFDEILWKRSNIVQRTAIEAQMAGMEEQIVLNDSTRRAESEMDKLVDHLERFGKTLPQEKVYLHLDNTSYFLGDTIWFAAYTRQTNDNMPSDISGVLYVELYNQDGYLIERKQVEMINGRGYGDFVLDRENYAGYYELRAYTRWQLNWGLYEHFHSKASEKWFLTKDLMHNYLRDYHKLYSRVFPVYDAPKEEGSYAEVMSLRPMQRVFTHDPDNNKMLLTLFPEGGNLVEGLPCRVAFEAAWDDGLALEGAIGNAKSELRGRGTFEVTPDKNMERDIVFVTKDGKKVKGKLPKPEKTGVSLKVTQDRDSVYIAIRTTADLATETLGLTIMHEGVLKRFEPVNCDDLSLAIPAESLAEGVNQATVFDAQGRVWADRLFFVRNDYTGRPNVLISGIKDSYEPYEQVTLSIDAPDGGGFMSLSVRDASHLNSTYDNASMLTEMLLSSEIKGFVENPEWFFEANDDARNRALDLLMMTQGWRRFDWHEMAVSGAWEMKQVAERTPVIEGQVYNVGEGEFDRDFNTEYEVAEMKQDDINNGIDKRILDFLENHLKENAGDNTDDEADMVDAMGGFSFVEQKSDTYNLSTESADSHWQGNLNGVLYGLRSNTRNLAEVRYFPGQKNNAFKNVGLKVHAEIASLLQFITKSHSLSLDIDSEDGHFKFQLPRHYGDYVLFLSAADTLKKGYEKSWISLLTDNDQEKGGPWSRFSVRVNWHYPRFVKPYNFYQTHTNYSGDPLLRHSMLDDALQLEDVSVWGTHNILHGMNDSLPAIMVDAYEAYNQALDAGFLNGRQEYIVRSYVGDYGLDIPYNSSIGYGIQEAFGYDNLRRVSNNVTTSSKDAYLRSNLRSYAPYDAHGKQLMFMSQKEWSNLHNFRNIDMYVIYTDYQPRLSGSIRYSGSNLPRTRIVTYPYPDDSKRYFYKNRRYHLTGFSYVHKFYNPDYSKRSLEERPKDYRRTIYWNPNLSLDENGHAEVQFWNNATEHKISVDAQGTSINGAIIGN